MEPLGFNQALAHQAETTVPTKLGGMLLSRLLHSGGCGKDVQLAVGEDTVYVKEKQFDFLGASLGDCVFGHRRDSSIRASRTRDPQDSRLTSELFEVAVSRDKNSLAEHRQGGRQAVYIRHFVTRFDFARLERLLQIYRNVLNGQSRKIMNRPSSDFLPALLPEDVKHFAPINHRH